MHARITAVGVAVAAALAAAFFTAPGRHARFLVGGAMVDVGYGLQDAIEEFDFSHHEEITPDQVWEQLVLRNSLASGLRHTLPRTPRHPLVAMLVCMDARVDTNELVGDTRHYYYVVRTAGSVMGDHEEEMLELAVANGVKVVVLTTHTDCAAEKVAGDPALAAKYPNLARAVHDREASVQHFLDRPAIRGAVEEGRLLVKRIAIDTPTDHLVVH